MMTRQPLALTVGDQLENRTIGPITQTDIVRFAGAGGDFNPLHHDAAHAQRAGLPGVISMGQMQAGMLAAFVTDSVRVEHLQSFGVRFAGPLKIGDTLTLSATVESVDGGAGTAQLDLAATTPDGTVVTGTATVAVAGAAADAGAGATTAPAPADSKRRTVPTDTQ